MNNGSSASRIRIENILVKAIHFSSVITLITTLVLGIGPARIVQAAPQSIGDKSNPATTNHTPAHLSETAAPLAQASYNYTITLPADTYVTMGDQTTEIPLTIANSAGSAGSVDSVKIGVPPSVYWVSTATTAPDGWQVEQIKNAGSGQAWVHFEAITTTNAITPGGEITFDIIVVGNQFGVFPSSDQDEIDILDFVTVKETETDTTFTRSGSLPSWERKALAVNLSGSPSSVGVGNLVNVTMNVFNRSTITQTSVVPTTTVLSGSGDVTLATGPTPVMLSIPPESDASFSWTYTATVSGDVAFDNSASNDNASSTSDQSDTVLIGDFTAALDLERTQIISGQLTSVYMTVKNNADSTITDVTPSALEPLGTATVTLVSGPTPTSVSSLISGATASFQWIYTVTGDIGATYQFTGAASTGGEASSNEASSPEGVIKKYTVSVTPRYTAIGTVTRTFEYVVANNGGAPVQLVEFTLPSDFTYVTGNASGGYESNWTVTKDGVQNPKIIRFEAPTTPTD
ncbi:MAG: hypothetical protein V3S14_17220, partial [Anaerolineae bacterium]